MTENTHSITPPGFPGKMAVRAISSIIIIGAILFLPAWTLKYWQAWVYMVILFIPMTFILIYFLKVNREFLVRRMQFKEKEREQSLIVKLTWIPLLLTFLLPGFDVRLGWSNVPTGIVIAADVLVFIGYAIVFLVFRKNSYASRIVEVTENQKVIDSGPYALVRHPMYSGTILMYTLSPLALGSYWAIIPALFIIPLLVMRIFSEEKILSRDLPGYTEYMQKVRWRVIPGIW